MILIYEHMVYNFMMVEFLFQSNVIENVLFCSHRFCEVSMPFLSRLFLSGRIFGIWSLLRFVVLLFFVCFVSWFLVIQYWMQIVFFCLLSWPLLPQYHPYQYYTTKSPNNN